MTTDAHATRCACCKSDAVMLGAEIREDQTILILPLRRLPGSASASVAELEFRSLPLQRAPRKRKRRGKQAIQVQVHIIDR
eukprot:11254317-Alexandrium_andersonii.AAC.1